MSFSRGGLHKKGALDELFGGGEGAGGVRRSVRMQSLGKWLGRVLVQILVVLATQVLVATWAHQPHRVAAPSAHLASAPVALAAPDAIQAVEPLVQPLAAGFAREEPVVLVVQVEQEDLVVPAFGGPVAYAAS